MPPDEQHPQSQFQYSHPTPTDNSSQDVTAQHKDYDRNGFVTSDQQRHQLDLPSRNPQRQYPYQLGPGMPPAAYTDYSLSYQHLPGDYVQMQDYTTSVQGRIESPKAMQGTFDNRTRSSFSEISGAGAPMSTAGQHRPSITSVGQLKSRDQNASLDGSDITSPTSSRGLGLQASDESVPQTNSIGKVEGVGVDSKNEQHWDKRPEWSELKTKAGKERKRLPLACIACRRKKIRCSGEKPACKHCLRSRIPCVYKVTTRKAAPRTDYMAMLDKRLKRMEERVIRIIPKEEAGKSSNIGRANVKPPLPGQLPKHGGAKKRLAQEAFGSELNDWAHASSKGSELASRVPKGSDQEENRLLTEGAEKLPSTEIQEHLSEVFFDCLYGQSYHLLHKPSFMRRLRNGKVPPVLILAVCAVAARFSSHPQVSTEPAFLRGESWAKPARDIALRRYDEPNLTILTVLLILGLHEFGTCQGGRSWMLGGMAMRMAYALQLHRELDHDPIRRKHDKSSELSFTDREIRRRTMWACFQMDRFNSSGTERPVFADEDTIKVQLPIKESNFQMEIPGPTESLQGEPASQAPAESGDVSEPRDNMGVASYIVRAIASWGRVIKYLNLGGKQKDPHPIWHPESQFALLKKQTEGFRESLPESMKYTSDNLENHAAEKLASQFLFLHICSAQAVLFLHRFAIPATPGDGFPKDMPKDFVNNAAKIAVDAASRISLLLNETSTYMVTAPFAGYCAFVSSTVHIWGMYSKNPQFENNSKRNLGYNIKYLSKMKKHWGMFHYMTENLKGIFKQHADAAIKGPNVGGSEKSDSAIFQYGDWFNKYPHGVSQTDYEDPATDLKRESGNDAVLGQKSDLQSVQQFFHSLSPKSSAEQQRKLRKKPSKPNIQNLNQHLSHHIAPERHQAHQHTDLQISPQTMSHQQQYSLHQQQQSAAPKPFPHNLYTPSNATFPPNAIPLQGQNQQSMLLPDLDRQMVFDGYSSTDPVSAQTPTASHHNLRGNPQDPNFNNIWDDTMDFPQALGASQAYGDPATSAWFMPFNLNPPDIGAEVDFGNLGDFNSVMEINNGGDLGASGGGVTPASMGATTGMPGTTLGSGIKTMDGPTVHHPTYGGMSNQ